MQRIFVIVMGDIKGHRRNKSTEKEEKEKNPIFSPPDALLAELEQTSLSLNVNESEPAKVCFLLERDKKEKPAATSAETNATQHKKLASGAPKVLSGRSIQHREEDVDNIYRKQEQEISDAENSLGQSPSVEHKTTDNLDSMLKDLTHDLQDLGIATVPKGHCASCQKPIAGKVITALGETWHPEHFLCAHCGKEVGSCPFYEREGKAYCQEDYHQLFSPRCAYCTAPIQEVGFHEKDGKPYCQKDFLTLFSPKCRGCDRPVMDQYLSALNTVWHPECFVCGDCFCSFDNGSFFELNGRPYCELHFHHHQGTVCQGCGKPIVGRCVSAMGYKFHPEHFVCAFCLTQLHNGIFQEQNGKTYCNPCFNKLFA
ncbi:hypothetical protein JD844_022153 [Phrynosoma platyrhinos]|uniref:LIM zinc-binding domain-containing protein n=1 Tax=Phrynosoma platyrhinos TaxID=52577 RepID=A0ABQ7SUL2_PHRPL|nr:hypothetical protein JD844_022153 [Phrynosoma platyrhinos]